MTAILKDQFSTALIEYLTTYSPLYEWVIKRIYAGMGHQNETMPYIAYSMVSVEPTSHYRGGSGVINETYQFDVSVGTHDHGRQIVDILRHALEGYEGEMGSEWIQAIYYETTVVLPDRITQGDTEKVFYQFSSEYTFVREIQSPILAL